MMTILLVCAVIGLVMAAVEHLPKHQLEAIRNGEGALHNGRVYTRENLPELRERGLVPKTFLNDDPEPAPAEPDAELVKRAEDAEAQVATLTKEKDAATKERDALQKRVDALTAENDKLKAAAKDSK